LDRNFGVENFVNFLKTVDKFSARNWQAKPEIFNRRHRRYYIMNIFWHLEASESGVFSIPDKNFSGYEGLSKQIK
jgi:hypothetical protein